jgi:GT2 family glycosyltransferase
VKPGALDALRDLLERRPLAAFAIPRLVYEDGSLQTSAGDLPSLAAALLGRRAQRKRSARIGFWWDGWAHNEERAIGRGHEACYLVRRRAIEDIGPQDEAFFLDWEGPDWTARARSRGWEVWFTPKAEVFHVGGASIRQAPYGWIYHSHRGMYRYFAKRRPPLQRPLIALLVAARMVAKMVAQALTRPTAKSMYERGHRSGKGAGP